MTEIALAVSGLLGLGGFGLTAWLIVAYKSAKDGECDARIAANTAVEQAAEANFKLAQVQTALTKELSLNETQAKELQEVINVPDPDMARDASSGNVHGMVTRLLAQLSVAKNN